MEEIDQAQSSRRLFIAKENSTFAFIIVIFVLVRFIKRSRKGPASINIENSHFVKSSSSSTTGMCNVCVFLYSRLQRNEKINLRFKDFKATYREMVETYLSHLNVEVSFVTTVTCNMGSNHG